MELLKSEQLPLTNEHDILVARQAVRRWAQEAMLGLVDQTKIVTATSELARNAVTYGGGGTMTAELLSNGVGRGIRLTFADSGPGIVDPVLAMQDGWTSGNGLGMGLSGTKRLVDEFSLDTAPGKGTRVTITKWKQK